MFRNLKKISLYALGRQILPALGRSEYCGQAEYQQAADHASGSSGRGWHTAWWGLGSNLYALGVAEKS